MLKKREDGSTQIHKAFHIDVLAGQNPKHIKFLPCVY